MRTLLLAALALLILPACDSGGSGDPTIGGAYVGVGAQVGDTITLTVPSGRESAPEATFNISLTFSNTEGVFAGTAVYAYPSLDITLTNGGAEYDCPVGPGGDAITCQFEIDRVTLTR